MQFFVKYLVNRDRVQRDCMLTVDHGRIVGVEESVPLPDGAAEYAVPGFIDIHTHGGDGCELMDGSVAALETMGRFYLRHGTTSFLASTVTESLPKTEAVLATAARFLPENRRRARRGEMAECFGIHLEGPWLSRSNLGAQNPVHCIPPERSSLEMIDRYADIIRMVTFSYHTPQSEHLLERLVESGIVPACGHDETIDERITEGFSRGIRMVTHIYCVTSSFRRVGGRKHLGTLEMALMTDGVGVEVIADGKHITKYFWDFILHNKRKEDIFVISDSMRCAGLPEDPEKVYKLGDMDVIVDEGVAWLPDKTAFAGSVATMYGNFRQLIRWGTTLSDAVGMTSWNQARLFGLKGLGEIGPGSRADLLLLDGELNIREIVKAGVPVKR